LLIILGVTNEICKDEIDLETFALFLLMLFRPLHEIDIFLQNMQRLQPLIF